MDTLTLVHKIEKLPPELQTQVADFVDFLWGKKIKPPAEKWPVFGSAKGKYTLAPDFDEPLDDFKEYLE
ncbi:MAG: DUF2281 domain-containing protein [Cytophagaceae bacterium]|nr:DUF2281 domain-containing protein [Cytophagaceae bacterium]